MLPFNQPELVKPLHAESLLHSAASWAALLPTCCSPRLPPLLSLPP